MPLPGRSLLIVSVLVIGPLQAHVVFACEMMDMVVLDECCCEEPAAHKDCVDSSSDATHQSSQDLCCERSVGLSLDEDARQDTPIVTPVEVRSDVDPPQVTVASFDVIDPSQRVAAHGVFQRLPIAGQSGSDTYLITQRLRI